MSQVNTVSWTEGLQNTTAPVVQRLRAMPKPAPIKAKQRAALPVIAVTSLVVVIAAQLLLGVVLTNGAYEISDLKGEKTALGREHATVSEELVAVQSPQFIAENAEAIGMVANTSPVYLRLSDGAVLGVPKPAAASSGLANAAVGNTLLEDVPLATELEAQRSADAAALAKLAGSPDTTGTAALVSTTGSVPLPGGTLPTVQTH